MDTISKFHKERAHVGLLRQVLIQVVGRSNEADGIPACCRQLLLHAPRIGCAEIAALIWSACRWGELQSLDWASVKAHRSCYVTQTKVQSSRRIRIPADVPDDVLQRLRLPVALPWHSRKRVAQSIRIALEEMGKAPPPGVKAGAHLVRHLTASGLSWAGWDQRNIASRLGHHETDSTAAYIHTRAEWQPAS